MTPDGKYIFAVDFDKTLILENKWPDVNGRPNKPLIDYLLMEREKKGTKIILWTCRCGQSLADAVEFCRTHGLEFDAVNENLPEMIEAYGNDSRKISADKYIDDAAVNPDGQAWSLLTQFDMSIMKSRVTDRED